MSENIDTSRAVVLRGRLQNYRSERAPGDFLLSDIDRQGAGLTAVAAALAGSGGAVGLAAMAGTKEIMNKVRFELDGKQMSGWLGWSPFENDDEVEVVAEPLKDGSYRVFAVLRPADRIMALYPHCSRGRAAHVKVAIKWFLKFFLSIYAVACLIMVIFFLGEDRETLAGFLLQLVGVGVLSGLIFAFIASNMSRKFKPFVRLAEGIFTVLGWQDVKSIDLPARSKAKRKSGDMPGLGTLYFRY